MRNNTVHILFIAFVITATFLSACSSAATAIPTTATTRAQTTQNNGGVTGSGNIQWPSAMPTDVPRFTYGTITGANNNILGNVQATFKNVAPDAFAKYQKDLKNAGWAITNATQSADGFEIDAAKTPRGVVAMFVLSTGNGLKGAVTYNDHSSQ